MIRTENNYSYIEIDGKEYDEHGNAGNAMVTRSLVQEMDSPLCLDIGADQGWWTRWVRIHSQTSSVYVFEPNPASYSELKDAFSDDTAIHIHNMAISSKDSTLDFHIIHGQSHSRNEEGPTIKVPCTRLSNILSTSQKIDIVKIDVEGHELHVFESLAPWIEKDLIRTIITEFTMKWYGTTFQEQIDSAKEFMYSIAPMFQEVYCISRCSDYIVGPIHTDDYNLLINMLIAHKLQTDLILTNISLQNRDIPIRPFSEYISKPE